MAKPALVYGFVEFAGMNLLLLSREDCELCEVAEARLREVASVSDSPRLASLAENFQRVDIASCEWLNARYGWSIPVFILVEALINVESPAHDALGASHSMRWLTPAQTARVSELLQSQLQNAVAAGPDNGLRIDREQLDGVGRNPHLPDVVFRNELYWPFSEGQLRKYLLRHDNVQ